MCAPNTAQNIYVFPPQHLSCPVYWRVFYCLSPINDHHQGNNVQVTDLCDVQFCHSKPFATTSVSNWRSVTRSTYVPGVTATKTAKQQSLMIKVNDCVKLANHLNELYARVCISLSAPLPPSLSKNGKLGSTKGSTKKFPINQDCCSEGCQLVSMNIIVEKMLPDVTELCSSPRELRAWIRDLKTHNWWANLPINNLMSNQAHRGRRGCTVQRMND